MNTIVRKEKPARMTIITVLCLLILVGVVLFFFIRSLGPVYSTVTIEAGKQDITVQNFLKKENPEAKLATTIDDQMLSSVGEYDITTIIDDKEYTSTLVVVDTTAPQAQSQEVELYISQTPTPDMFVDHIDDATHVTISFAQDEEISTAKAGNFEVHVILEDEGKNQTTITSSLCVKVDDVPPVIEGIKNIKVVKGDTVSYKKGVTVSDNVDEEVELVVDSSKVNLDEAGTYEATYSATDSTNNTTTQTIKVYVVNDDSDYTEDEVYEISDAIVAEIIDDSMTQREKCRKIYDYVKSHMSYVDTSEKTSWTNGAMKAFNTHKGDCFNYFAMTKALLTSAGVENMDLTATKHTHYWNFVKVEEGWYHLDTTPRSNHPDLFLRTDAWIDNYSRQHGNCFSYDDPSKPASAKD